MLQQSIPPSSEEGGMGSSAAMTPNIQPNQIDFPSYVSFPAGNTRSGGIPFLSDTVKDLPMSDPSYMVPYTSGGGNASIPLSMYQQALEKPDEMVDPEHVSGDLGYYDSRRHPTNYSQSTYFDPLMGGLGESKLSDAYPNSEPLPPERKRSRVSCLENPKRIRSAYNFFSQDFYNSKTVENMTKDTINEMAQEWHNLSKEERQKYQQRTDEDRKRYERELERIKDYFRSYNLPPMLFKRERQAFLYNTVASQNAEVLANYLAVMHYGDLDIALAFVEAIIKALQLRQNVQLPAGRVRESGTAGGEPGGKSAGNGDGDLVYRCYHQGCDKVFKSLRNLTNHQKTHDESRRRKYPCPFPGCQKVFLTSYGLSKHRLSHEKNRELQKCSRCEKTFQTKEGLMLHFKNKHTKELKYQCDQPNCNEAFARKSDLRMHQLRKHSGQKPYVCKECANHSYASKSELTRHMKNAHNK
ncbi:hypothetical protein WA588_001985 [Blastocystis sp. NMH]